MVAASFKLLVLTVTTLLFAFKLAIANAAKPVPEQKSLMKSRLTRRIIHSNHSEIVERQVKSLRRSSINIPALFNRIQFTVDISVGDSDPPRNYTLVVDSGSSNTWVGANRTNPYVVTNTSQPTNNTVKVGYGQGIGNFTGVEYIDKIAIIGSESNVVFNQSIGAVNASDAEGPGLDIVDGILGIGPTDLTIGSLTPDNTSSIPTVTDNIFAMVSIQKNLVTVFFQPFNSSDPNGTVDAELNWGGTNSSLYIGDITYANVTSRPLANAYWAIDAASVTYGSTPLLSNAVGHVDTGTTFVYLASSAFDKYKAATGAVLNDEATYWTINSSKLLQNLTISIAGVDFILTPDAQIFPNMLVSCGNADQIYLTVFPLETNTSKFDMILGLAFLERFYSVYDTDNKRVGLAQTNFTYAIFNNATFNNN